MLIMVPLIIFMVNRAITLNHQTCFVAEEIGDVVTKLMLPSKLESAQSAVPEMLP
jgi:hypothetical protein